MLIIIQVFTRSLLCLLILFTSSGQQVVAAGSIEWDKDARISGGFKAPVQLKNGCVLASRTVGIQPQGAAVVCMKSMDGGVSWSYLSEIVRDETPGTDIGDGHTMQLRNGDVLYSYRRNHHTDQDEKKRSFRLEVAISRDNGTTWKPHSVIASCDGSRMGLWSTFLLEKSDGTLQCYYDDEDTPGKNGFIMHQWLTMKTWDAKSKQWINPVTISRAHNPEHLSRDGMCSVVELNPDKLLCTFETVQTSPPHRGLLMMVTSDDGGKTWSWQKQERRVLYQPKDIKFNALAPWIIRLTNGDLFCVFTTDEDRNEPADASTGVLFQDVKYLISHDSGITWLGPYLIDNHYPCYFPGACEIKDNSILVQYDQRQLGSMNKRGKYK